MEINFFHATETKSTRRWWEGRRRSSRHHILHATENHLIAANCSKLSACISVWRMEVILCAHFWMFNSLHVRACQSDSGNFWPKHDNWNYCSTVSLDGFPNSFSYRNRHLHVMIQHICHWQRRHPNFEFRADDFPVSTKIQWLIRFRIFEMKGIWRFIQ